VRTYMLLTECQHSTTCFATSMTQCILNHRHPPTFFFLHGSEVKLQGCPDGCAGIVDVFATHPQAAFLLWSCH
jgi:hypothetical protein